MAVLLNWHFERQQRSRQSRWDLYRKIYRMARRTVEEDWNDEDSFDDALEDDPTVPCPYCNRAIHEDAPRCPYCENYISAEDSPRAANILAHYFGHHCRANRGLLVDHALIRTAVADERPTGRSAARLDQVLVAIGFVPGGCISPRLTDPSRPGRWRPEFHSARLSWHGSCCDWEAEIGFLPADILMRRIFERAKERRQCLRTHHSSSAFGSPSVRHLAHRILGYFDHPGQKSRVELVPKGHAAKKLDALRNVANPLSQNLSVRSSGRRAFSGRSLLTQDELLVQEWLDNRLAAFLLVPRRAWILAAQFADFFRAMVGPRWTKLLRLDSSGDASSRPTLVACQLGI